MDSVSVPDRCGGGATTPCFWHCSFSTITSLAADDCHDGMSDGKYVLRFKSGKARKAALQQLEFTQPPGTVQAGPGSAGRGSSSCFTEILPSTNLRVRTLTSPLLSPF